MALEGTHFVRVLRSALQKARKHWPRTGPRMEIRRQSLKLRFWGLQHSGDEGGLLDLSYESIKARPKSGLYELRLDDEIGGLANIRVIFFLPPASWISRVQLPLPAIWILEALPKKRNEWTTFDLDRFDAARAIVKERFYEGGSG